MRKVSSTKRSLRRIKRIDDHAQRQKRDHYSEDLAEQAFGNPVAQARPAPRAKRRCANHPGDERQIGRKGEADKAEDQNFAQVGNGHYRAVGNDQAVLGQTRAGQKGTSQGPGDADEEGEEGLKGTENGEVAGKAKSAARHGNPDDEEDEDA